MSSLKKLSVIGLGKLGACMAATFTRRGFEVLGIDINPEAVRKLNAGESPVDEPLLAETITAGHKRLRASTDPKDAAKTDASFFIVPSPSLPDGSFSNEFLMRAMQPVAQAVKRAQKKITCSSSVPLPRRAHAGRSSFRCWSSNSAGSAGRILAFATTRSSSRWGT